MLYTLYLKVKKKARQSRADERGGSLLRQRVSLNYTLQTPSKNRLNPFMPTKPVPVQRPSIEVLLSRKPFSITCQPGYLSTPNKPTTCFDALRTTVSFLEKQAPSVLPLHPYTRVTQTEQGWVFYIPYQYKGMQYAFHHVSITVSFNKGAILSARFRPPAQESEYPKDT